LYLKLKFIFLLLSDLQALSLRVSQGLQKSVVSLQRQVCSQMLELC